MKNDARHRIRFLRVFAGFLAVGASALHADGLQTTAAFPGAGGNYGGIIQTPDNNPLTSGLISLQLLDTGSFSGSASFEGYKFPFTCKFDAGTGQFVKSFPVPSGMIFDTITIQADLDSTARTITGTFIEVSEGSPYLTANFTLSGSLPDPVLGPKLAGSIRTAFIDPPNVASGQQEIPGDGFTLITVGHSANTRAARFAGRLNDYNGVYSSGSSLRGASYTVFGDLYKVRKSSAGRTFGGAGVIDNGADSPGINSTLSWGKEKAVSAGSYGSGLNSTVSWRRENAASAGYYGGGINTTVFINGQVYPHASPNNVVPIGKEVTNRLNATIHFKRGNLVNKIDIPMVMTPAHVRIGNGNPYQLTVKVNQVKGLFQGTFMHPDSGQLTKFQGTFQAAVGLGLPGAVVGEGRGSFAGSVDPNNAAQAGPPESGSVRITVNL